MFCSSRGIADGILNAVLFAPLGAALVLAGWSVAIASLAGLALSALIEILQTALAGRYAAVADVISNTTGAFLGAQVMAHRARIAAWISRHPVPVGAMTAALPLAVWGVSAWLLVPAPQAAPWYGQWTADLGPSLGVYDGRILEAAIHDQPAPSWRLQDSGKARQDLLDGHPLTVRFVAGSPPRRLAPVFSIYDDRQQEVLLLGAEGDDLVLRIRMRAAAVRLDQPALRWPGALRGVAAGDTVALRLARAGALGFCIRRDGAAECARPPAWRGWSLLLGPDAVPHPARRAFDFLWIVAGLGLLVAGVWMTTRPAGHRERHSPARRGD